MKNYMEIFWFMTLYKTLIGAEPPNARSDKVDRFIRVYSRTRYLVIFGPEKYDVIYNKIRYLVSQKIGITYAFSHNYAKIKIGPNGFLLLERALNLYNFIILIKLVFDKNQNHHF